MIRKHRGHFLFWGGHFPGQSCKTLTFANYFLQNPDAQSAPGWVEASSSSTALALLHLARAQGKGLRIACEPQAVDRLLSQGFLPSELQPVPSMGEALRFCEAWAERGWHWPRQFTNPALIEAAKTWLKERVLQPLLREGALPFRHCHIALGTGATALGLARALEEAVPSDLKRPTLWVWQVSPQESLPGLRHYPTQNLGRADLFYAHREFKLELCTLEPGHALSAGQALLKTVLPQEPSLIFLHAERAPRAARGTMENVARP